MNTTRIKSILGLIVLLFLTFKSFGQQPPEEFFTGLDLMHKDNAEAKKEFMMALGKDSLFHGTYHFLGVIFLENNQLDSAVFCFKKSIALNKENLRHTKEMTYVRLIDTYLYQHDFNNSFEVAREAFALYPDNTNISFGLKDACLWSFYTKYNSLDISYLSPVMKAEYVVNSIPEEYLIVRKLMIDGNHLSVDMQSLTEKNGANYDILKCSYSEKDPAVDVSFRINWNMSTDFGGKVADTKKVIDDYSNPVYERLGARLVADSDLDLAKEIKKLTRQGSK